MATNDNISEKMTDINNTLLLQVHRNSTTVTVLMYRLHAIKIISVNNKNSHNVKRPKIFYVCF